MTSIELPARSIPVPALLSAEAQGLVAAMAPVPTPAYPSLDDREGWRQYIQDNDARTRAMISLHPAADSADVELRTFDGVDVYVVTPPSAAEGVVQFEIHGGAFIFMAGEVCRTMAVNASLGAGRVLWGVDYRMPPEHPYPTPLDDCLTAYRGLLDVMPAERIVLAGGSAGGNLAAALVLRARDEGLPLPAAVHLGTPEVDLTESGDSFHTNLGLDNILTPLRPVNELYANGEDLRHPYLSPLFADLTGFPPTILTTGTRDLFLSNTVLMHRALRRAGVEAELHVLEGASHGGFFGYAPEDRELKLDVQRFFERHCPAHAG